MAGRYLRKGWTESERPGIGDLQRSAMLEGAVIAEKRHCSTTFDPFFPTYEPD